MTRAPRRLDLLAAGDPVVDVVVHARELPGWGEKTLARADGVFAGGCEANAACAASRLGWRCAIAGTVGDDLHGAFLGDDLRRHGVDTDALRQRAGSASAMALVTLSPRGERSIVYAPLPPAGAGSSAAALALLPEARLLYTTPYDADRFERLSAAARAAGAAVAIDIEAEAAREPALLRRLLAGCDIAFLNDAGFRAGTGAEPTPDSLRALHAYSRAHTLVVSLGGDGAMAVDRHGCARQAAFGAQVLDTTGAGDCFNAAFLVAHGTSRGLQAALAYACAAASCCVEAVGARSGLPDPAAVEARLARGPAAIPPRP